jgi:hypothetical protein
MMTAWQRYWQMHENGRNPPNVRSIPQTLGYLRTYVQGIACLEPQRQGEHARTFRRRVYWTLRALAEAGSPPRVMRILQLYPAAHWKRIWFILHNWTSEAVKVTWYMVIQDILPTNERLYKMRLAGSPLCRQCGALDTVLHRVTECGEGARLRGMDQTTHSVDSSHRPGQHTVGLDDETPVPAMAADANPGGVMDTGPNGVV